MECGLGEPNTRRGAAGCRRWVVVGLGGGVEGGEAAASIFTLYRRLGVKLYTDNGSGRGQLKCLDGVREVAGARSVRAPKQSRDAW